MKFTSLIKSIQDANFAFNRQASNAVNINLTLRNWYIGFYIIEFEQKGSDRADYGAKLLNTIAGKILIKGLSETNLKLCRTFYKAYPEVYSVLPSHIIDSLPILISQSPTDLSLMADNQTNIISQSLTVELKDSSKIYLNKLLTKASFTHFVELIGIEDTTKRNFYELLIIHTTPSIRELKRQINSLAYERIGLSNNIEKAIRALESKINPQSPVDVVKSHYFLEFLGFNSPELIEENELEQGLITHLQNFILELGNGFCFEGRQKRILIGQKYYFIDLVFYHRFLKCHVLIELKVQAFEHSNASQLNTYLNYYKKEVKQPNDNPPIGILLVANKDNTLVEYATAGMDKNLFVSKYMLQLPNKKQLEDFLRIEFNKL